MKQVPLALAPEPLSTFEAYLPGPNAAAVQHLADELPPAAPVYLWGPPGCGKTHLLRAMVLACQQRGLRVGSFDATTPLPWQFDPGWSMLVIDDVQQLDADTQHAAFALLVEAQGHGLPWAAAGDVPAVDLALRDDLRTRIGWGPIFALGTLNEPETRAVLRRESDRRGMFLSDELLDYLLNRFARDLGTLMPLLERLDEFAMSKRRAFTVPLLKEMLDAEAQA